jgi:hypothetical protein
MRGDCDAACALSFLAQYKSAVAHFVISRRAGACKRADYPRAFAYESAVIWAPPNEKSFASSRDRRSHLSGIDKCAPRSLSRVVRFVFARQQTILCLLQIEVNHQDSGTDAAPTNLSPIIVRATQ